MSRPDDNVMWKDRGDGRKAHYGPGKQPWDTALERGWAPAAAAFNVTRYLRRDKLLKHSEESARVYFRWLRELAEEEHGLRPARPNVKAAGANQALNDLIAELTPEELARCGSYA